MSGGGSVGGGNNLSSGGQNALSQLLGGGYNSQFPGGLSSLGSATRPVQMTPGTNSPWTGWQQGTPWATAGQGMPSGMMGAQGLGNTGPFYAPGGSPLLPQRGPVYPPQNSNPFLYQRGPAFPPGR